MKTSARRAVSAYGKVEVETGVIGADPLRLVVMLYEGAAAALAQARRHFDTGDVAERGAAISKAISIIDGGLKLSLDLSAGGELAARLASLYDYMAQRLVHANLRNDPSAVDEVRRLLGELESAWRDIAGRSKVA